MKRILLVIIAGALAAVAILYGLRLAERTSTSAVTALLPRDTILLAHVPDFKHTREQWHQSDVYQLYSDPAVQDFLRNPLTQVPKKNSVTQTVREIEQLDLTDAFVALTSMANDNPKVVAGFRFRGNEEDAEKIIGRWRSQLWGKARITNRESVQYQQHKIDVVTGASFSWASVYDGHWFFGANDVTELKALLDRADGHVKNTAETLDRDETFRAARSHVPANYAALFYLRPKTFADKLAALRVLVGQQIAPGQRPMLDQIRSICGTTGFEKGKIHDVVYIGMPELEQDAAFSRSSLALGTKETFFYLASLVDWSKRLALLDSANGFFGASLKKIGTALAAAGITADDWKAAFGSELGILADWPGNAHWPSLFATLPVKDAARAKEIAGVLTRASDEDATWTETEKDGVRYFSMQSPVGLIGVHPTVAVSARVMVIGLDETSVEAAIQRSENRSSELSNSENYKNAARAVPAPTNFFAYIDTALLYSRLDATLRPILLMGAAFIPAMNEHVDLGKLPPAEVVIKHLSPIVSSQRYKGDGYIAESVGPITLNQSGIGLVVGCAILYQRGGAGLNVLGMPPVLAPPGGSSASPSPVPSGTP
jgi:hypothetical protein